MKPLYTPPPKHRARRALVSAAGLGLQRGDSGADSGRRPAHLDATDAAAFIDPEHWGADTIVVLESLMGQPLRTAAGLGAAYA